MANNITIKVKKLREDAVIPTYAHDGDVGMDFTAVDLEYDKEKDLYIYHTGLAFESEYDLGQFLFPRSSNRKTDAYLTNSVGIADSAIYRGEIMFCYKNRDSYMTLAKQYALDTAIMNANSYKEFQEMYQSVFHEFMEKQNERALDFAPYKVGDRVGQMVMLSTPKTITIETDTLSETERGANGFGSTGA